MRDLKLNEHELNALHILKIGASNWAMRFVGVRSSRMFVQ